MKTTITFDLPEDSEQHFRALHGAAYRGLIGELDTLCRNALKHGHDHKHPNEVLTWVRDFLFEGLDEIHNIDH